MQRLGAAALGMYNRRKVHILSSELNDDLKFFSLERSLQVSPGGRTLSQADLLLGSFFFVHKSEARTTAGVEEHHEEAFAFEFLHNTFGEFLTADFILRRGLAEVEQLKALQENDVLRPQLEQRLGDADGFRREWFAGLVYTPLFTRPVVLEMMREWTPHLLRERGFARQSFISNLDTVVHNQITRLLNKREMPSIIRKETVQEGYRAPFGDHPMLGHIAIYSINLILLRVITGDPEFVFDEGIVGTYEDGARPWDRMMHVWRSWFSLENLKDLTAVMTANRNGSQIRIRAKERFQVAESQSRLDIYLNVALSVGDDISAGLAGLLLFDPSTDNQLTLPSIGARLEAEDIDLSLQIATKNLTLFESSVLEDTGENFIRASREALVLALDQGKFDEMEALAVHVRNGIRRLMYAKPWSDVTRVFRRSVDPEFCVAIASRAPSAAVILDQIALEIGDHRWREEFHHRMEREFHPRFFEETILRSPKDAVGGIRLLSQVGGGRFSRRFHHEFLEHLLHPRFLEELMQRNPEGAEAWFQLIGELGGKRFFARIDPEWLERIFRPQYFEHLLGRSPVVALTWLQMAWEIGGAATFSRGGASTLWKLYFVNSTFTT